MWRGGEELRGRRGVKKAMAGKKRAEVSLFPREPARAPADARDSPERARPEPGRGGTKPSSVRPEPRESVFCIHEARPGNRANEIKHGDLHGAGSAKARTGQMKSNTP